MKVKLTTSILDVTCRTREVTFYVSRPIFYDMRGLGYHPNTSQAFLLLAGPKGVN